MQPVDQSARRYDGTTILFHWATVILVLTQWFGAQTIDWFPGALRVDARSVHIVVGLLLGLLLGARIVWRLTGGRRLPAADRGVLHLVAKGTHWGLYLLLIAVVAVGVFLAWVRGDSIFNLFTIPAYNGEDHALAHQVQRIHATFGWVILGTAGLHAAAAIMHRLAWRDGVLERMLPSVLR